MINPALMSRWISGCHQHSGGGNGHLSAGDMMHRGLHDYDEPFPCPNGLPIDTREPGECEGWRERIAKARRDIEAHESMFRVRMMAEEISTEAFNEWCLIMAEGIFNE